MRGGHFLLVHSRPKDVSSPRPRGPRVRRSGFAEHSAERSSTGSSQLTSRSQSVRSLPAVTPVNRIRHGIEAALVVGWVAFVLNAVSPTHGWVEAFFKNGVYYGLITAASLGCLLRAVVDRRDRWAWGMIGGGLAVWTIGDLYYLFRLQDLTVTPVPSLADAFYLAYFPLIYIGVVLLMRERVAGATKALWLDGLTAALTVAAAAACLLLGPLRAASDGSALSVTTNLSYPLGDVVLLALLTALATAQRFRLDRGPLLLVCGLVSAAAADTLYLTQSNNGTYTEGGMTDALWAASLLLIGAAAWRDSPVRAERVWRPIATLPLVCAAAATLLLSIASTRRLGTAGTAFAAAAILTVLVRLAMTLRENKQLLESASRAALTDALTGLPNRRSLMRDLEALAGTATTEDPLALVLFDLNGFKTYNDRFGHPAGDALLQQLGHRLQALEAHGAQVYRLGGDEFALLSKSDGLATASVIERAVEALSEEAEGFSVSASFGAAFIPEDAPGIGEALRVADLRLYSRKGAFYSDHDHPHLELLRILDARDPASAETRALAAEIAGSLSDQLGLVPDQRREIIRATLLRDVGTLALPDDLARPTQPLTEAQSRLVTQHPLIGERILSAMPALRPLAPIVRSSYENWDGTGYPDRLTGDDIPLASRIVAVSTARARTLQDGSGAALANTLDPELLRLSQEARATVTAINQAPT
jgi:two-component system, cell cycle response regulator